ncbi:MAG TPA: serine hydrolase [Longimicrobium sp.]|nr:serine hydrolase [Longimicrobium sp.]
MEGTWASETVFQTSLRGELEVRREGDGWRATLAGAESRFGVTGDSVRFGFPGGRGGFRGVLAADGTITGFWLQPSGETEDRQDPGGSGQPFATPLVLRREGDAWRGTVRPLDDRFTLWLRIFRNEQGTLVGAFRNPEMNSRGGASQFRVTRQGDSVWFSVRPDTAMPEIRHGAALVRSPDRLRIFWRDLGRTLELARHTPAEAAAFFPRPPGEPAYAYRPPPETGDGWRTARASEMGMDEEALAGAVQGVIDGDPAARRPNLIHSLLVARRGRLVLEEYFFGHGRDTPHDIRSVGKTFGSVMLGAAMREGAPLSAQTRIYDVLAGMGPFAHPDPRKARITLAHLMTHTAGLACDDNDDASPGNEGTMQTQRAQPDWWKYTLDLPMAHDPGTRYAYCSANANLVGAALTAGTRTWLPELFRRTIAEPLQFGPWYWNLMPTGEGYLGGGAFLRPRDLLKIGQAFLDGGVWNGRRIVDSAWVALSTAVHAEISPATTGLSAEDFPNFYGEGLDGYAWHLSTFTSGGRGYQTYQATGNGGQVLIVVPELDLVVVFTGGNYMQGGIWGRWGQEIVGDRIIPAIRR